MAVATSTAGSSLYDAPGLAQIPATAATSFAPQDAVVRDLYVDLAAADAQIAAKLPSPPPVVTIYADTLHIPGDYSRTVDTEALVVFARRIDIDGAAELRLDFRHSQSTRVVLYFSELAGVLTAHGVLPDGSTASATVTPAGSKGVLVALEGGRLSLRPLQDVSHPVFGPSPDLRSSLVSIFQVATALFDTRPDDAAGMLRWIVSCTSAAPGLESICLQASSLLSLLGASRAGVPFVPHLSRDVYVTTAEAFTTAAAAFEEQYERLADGNQAIDDRIAAAKLMAQSLAARADFEDRLVEQARQNVADAVAAAAAAQANLTSQQHRVDDAKAEFKREVDRWEVDQIVRGIREVTLTVLELGATLGAALLDPAVLGAAPKAAADAAASVAKSAEEVKESLEKLKLLIETLRDIATIAETAYQTVNPSFDAPSAGPALQQIDTLQQRVGSGEDLRGQADQWATFRLSLDSVLDEAVKVPLPMAAEYKLALDILTVYGESLCANQLATVTALQEFSRLVLQRQVTAGDQQRLQQYIADLHAREAPNDAAMQAFYEAYVERKRWLFIALENYCDAYRYWALREPGFTPSIVSSVADLASQLAAVADDYENALDAFSPPPQPFAVTEVSITIDDARALAELRRSGTLSMVVGLDEPAFETLDRVRVDTVRVYLDGAKVSSPNGGTDPVSLLVSTSGSYADRLGSTSFAFTAAPVQRAFEYRLGEEASPVLDGKLAHEVRYAYFVPTPFTEWRVEVPAAHNQHLDLTGLTRVRMAFGGTGIGRG